MPGLKILGPFRYELQHSYFFTVADRWHINADYQGEYPIHTRVIMSAPKLTPAQSAKFYCMCFGIVTLTGLISASGILWGDDDKFTAIGLMVVTLMIFILLVFYCFKIHPTMKKSVEDQWDA
ncbi:MAG: hypothetical protein A3F41_02910 [Coxiella sp. RIFCSPHIGHO2_12_FULL_44_14]|nr:MAG: hypothetical protein A3F41_02910 [Coxiella sp. RIFCSPHIGHO2_12_FULL_44_14]